MPCCASTTGASDDLAWLLVQFLSETSRGDSWIGLSYANIYASGRGVSKLICETMLTLVG